MDGCLPCMPQNRTTTLVPVEESGNYNEEDGLELPHLGADSVESCVCKVGFMDNRTRLAAGNLSASSPPPSPPPPAPAAPPGVVGNVSSMPDCQLCLFGTDCSSDGIIVERLPVRRGFWRPSLVSTDVRECPDARRNCSVEAVCVQSSSGCEGSSTSLNATRGRDGCMPTLHGPFCRLCMPPAANLNRSDPIRYYIAGSRDRPARCEDCDDGKIVKNIGIYIGIGMGLLALLGLAVAVDTYVLSKSVHKWLRAVQQQSGTKIKILLSFFIVVPKVPHVYDISLPPDLARLLSYFDVTLNLSAFDTPLQCLGRGGFVYRLKFWTYSPLVVVLLILVLSTCRQACSGERCTKYACRVLERSTPWILRLMFLAYPTVTNVAFSAFSCYEFETGDSWLVADVSIQCNSPYHRRFVVGWAIAAMALYPIGLLVVCTVLLLCARKAVRSGNPTRLSTAIAFLHQEYRPMVFWWELMEMLRRLLLLGLLAFLPARGSLAQVACGALVCSLYLFLQMQTSPFRGISEDYIGKVGSFFLMLYFGCCIIYKLQEKLQRPEMAALLSESERENDKLPALGSITLGSAFGIVLFSALIVIMQLREERERRLKEGRASKARRLRFKKSHKEVPAPILSHGVQYHVFLSHVWGTGQDQMRIVKQRMLEMIPNVSVFLDVDDLEEISKLEGYVEGSQTILIHLSNGYFNSKNCMRELTTASKLRKHIIALLDPDRAHGGLTKYEVHQQLCDATSLYAKWDFAPDTASGVALFDNLFAHDAIEWNRLGHFQDVTMRLIAERVVFDADLHGSTMVQDELANQTPTIKPPTKDGSKYHVFCSPRNTDAYDLLQEVARTFQVSLIGNKKVRPSSMRQSVTQLMKKNAEKDKHALYVTTNLKDLSQCDHMLVYLTSTTWRSGEKSDELGEEIRTAMDEEVHLLLAHEMPGLGEDEARPACEFSTFFEHPDGATPQALLQAGIYGQIAVPLKGGAWRAASMVMMAQALSSAGKVEGLGLQQQMLPPQTPRKKNVVKEGAKNAAKFLDSGFRLQCRKAKRRKAGEVPPSSRASGSLGGSIGTLGNSVSSAGSISVRWSKTRSGSSVALNEGEPSPPSEQSDRTHVRILSEVRGAAATTAATTARVAQDAAETTTRVESDHLRGSQDNLLRRMRFGAWDDTESGGASTGSGTESASASTTARRDPRARPEMAACSSESCESP